MSDCCQAVEGSSRASCPGCRRPGRQVGNITLKALLRPKALVRLGTVEHRFCPSAECPIVYFAPGSVFSREDVAVPVFQKEPTGGRAVCYCFEVTEDQIRQEVESSGESASVERIRALVQEGRCACELRNPQGACCLGSAAAIARLHRPAAQPETRTDLSASAQAGVIAAGQPTSI